MAVKDDPKFQRWLESVSPDTLTKANVLAAVDWGQVLKLLLDIFQILLGLGCFAAAKLSARVKEAMKSGNRDLIAANLSVILSDAKKARKK